MGQLSVWADHFRAHTQLCSSLRSLSLPLVQETRSTGKPTGSKLWPQTSTGGQSLQLFEPQTTSKRPSISTDSLRQLSANNSQPATTLNSPFERRQDWPIIFNPHYLTLTSILFSPSAQHPSSSSLPNSKHQTATSQKMQPKEPLPVPLAAWLVWRRLCAAVEAGCFSWAWPEVGC